MLKGITEKELSGDVVHLATAQENDQMSNTSHMTEAESLVCYVLSNFSCGNFNGELKNATEVFRNVDAWLQEKQRSGMVK